MAGTLTQSAPRVAPLGLRRPKLLPLFLLIGTLCAVCLFFVWSRIELTHLEYDLSRLNGELRSARQEVKTLRIEAASLRHPKRIERLARKQGLRTPTPNQVILVK